MHKEVITYISFVITVLISAVGQAQVLTPFTSKSRPSCDVKSPCLVTEPKTKQNFRVIFSLEDNEGGGKVIESVTIENLKTRKKETFPTPKCEAVFPGEYFRFYTGDLNGDGYLDLALHAFMSTKGPMQYQFIFDPKTNHFTIKGPVPEPDSAGASEKKEQ